MPAMKLPRRMIGGIGRWASRALNIFACLILIGPTVAFANCRDDAMIVFDASGSMSAGFFGERRIDTARKAMADILPDITATRATGLVTYGGTMAIGCSGVELRLPPMTNSAGLINAALLGMGPGGQTPLTEAVWLAAQTLDVDGASGTVVLITDGKENCGFNACALGIKLRNEAPNMKVHVVGFHLRSRDEASVACLSAQTNGTYTSTRDYESLRQALRTTLMCPMISQRETETEMRRAGRPRDLARLASADATARN
jgi:Ca-activated chloride channel family protein